MIRTTTELITEIIGVNPTIPLTPFISAASVLVDQVRDAAQAGNLLNPVESGDPSREERLVQIETWLAAHFYTIRDPRREQEAAGSVRATYQSKIDYNLALSHYGQMAMVLDQTGTLRALSENKSSTSRTARVFWAGSCRE